MKKKNKELDVDSIGNQEQEITLEEKKQISDFIRQQKAKKLQRVKKPKIAQ